MAQPLQLTPADLKPWVSLYPQYFEQGLSEARGRRVAKAKLVGCAWAAWGGAGRGGGGAPCAPSRWHPPTHPPGTDVDAREVAEAVSSLGFPHACIAMEPKCHPAFRVFESNPWRVRIKLKGADGKPTLASFPTKQSLLVPVAAAIPRTEARRQLTAAKAQARAEAEQREREAARAAKSVPTPKMVPKALGDKARKAKK